MDAARALTIVELAIKNAVFDRERFRVVARESVDGTTVELHADTVHRDAQGRLSTNFDSIPVESVSADAAGEEELRLLVESMVGSVAEFVEEQSETPYTRLI